MRQHPFLTPRPLLLCALLLLALDLSACSGCKKKKEVVETPEVVVEEVDQAPELTVDEKTAQIFDAVMANCEMTSAGKAKNCQGDQYNDLVDHVKANRMALLTPVVDAYISNDSKRRSLAVLLLRDFIWQLLPEANPDEIAEGDVRALLGTLQGESPATSSIALPTAQTVLALTAMKKMDDEARATLRDLDPEGGRAAMWLHLAALKGYVSQARLGAFDLVEQAFASDKPEMRVGALEAVLLIPNWNEEEQAKLCKWGSELMLAEEGNALEGKPVAMLMRCPREPWHALIVKEAEKREKAMTYGRPFADHFRFVCPRKPGLDKRTDALCMRQYDLLLRVARNPKYATDERVFAIGMLADRWVDEQAIQDLEPLYQDADPMVAQVAQSLGERVKRIKASADENQRKKAAGQYTPPPQGPGEGG